MIFIQNEDDQCFRWCFVRYLNHVDKNSAIIKNIDEELNFKDMKFSVKKDKYQKIQNQNKINIKVFGY